MNDYVRAWVMLNAKSDASGWDANALAGAFCLLPLPAIGAQEWLERRKTLGVPAPQTPEMESPETKKAIDDMNRENVEAAKRDAEIFPGLLTVTETPRG